MNHERIEKIDGVKIPQSARGGLPDLQKIIENAKRLKASGISPKDIHIIAHPEGFNLSTDVPALTTPRELIEEN